MFYGADDYYKYPTALAPTYGRWAPVAHGGALPLGAGAPHRGAIMPHLCVTEKAILQRIWKKGKAKIIREEYKMYLDHSPKKNKKKKGLVVKNDAAKWW